MKFQVTKQRRWCHLIIHIGKVVWLDLSINWRQQVWKQQVLEVHKYYVIVITNNNWSGRWKIEPDAVLLFTINLDILDRLIKLSWLVKKEEIIIKYFTCVFFLLKQLSTN
jgi:hypothetical protein